MAANLAEKRPRSEDSEKGSLGILQFGFPAKTSFNADDALLMTRSLKFKIKDKVEEYNIWKRPPPDFRVTVYEPNPPKRNTLDAMQPWRYGTVPGERDVFKREQSSLLPVIFKHRKDNDEHFVTQFRTMRPFTAKKKFVTDGQHEAGAYNMPEPHDFRGYPPIHSLGLPEFITDYEKDPYNNNFHTKTRNTIHGLGFDCVERDVLPVPQMAPAMKKKPRYEPELVLPRDSWPTKSGAYTRFRRRNRHPHSAFMERVETELTTRWAKEKMDQALQAHERKTKSAISIR